MHVYMSFAQQSTPRFLNIKERENDKNEEGSCIKFPVDCVYKA